MTPSTLLAPAHPRPGRAKRQKNRRFVLAVVAATLVPIILLLALLLPRVLGVSIFPSGFPLVGASPVATVTVTVQSQAVQDTYLLLAEPGIARPDPTTRAIPDRLLTASASDGRAVAASGRQTIPGAQARGTLLFDNSSQQTFFLPGGTPFMASDSVQIVLAQAVTIPPRQEGADGTISAPALASASGAAGNIAPGALATTCCNNQVVVSNPQAFSGGTDSRTVHIVTQADLNGARDNLTSGLEKRALQNVQRQIAANEVKAGSPTFEVNSSSDQPVGARVDTVTVQVSVTATVTVYNMQTARQMALQLLGEKATQSPGDHYRPNNPPVVATPVVTAQEKNGVIYLSISVHGVWFYQISQQQINLWRQSIKGATPQLAQAFMTQQSGVAHVTIQLPFGADHLPTSLDQIQVVLVTA